MEMNRLDELRRRRKAAEAGGGPARQARQHQEGKLSARERVELLLDEASFEEMDELVTHRCRDFGMEEAGGSQNPGLSVFTRTPDGAVYHRYTIGAEFDEHNNRGIDPYSPVWNLFDLLPQGRGDWYPSHGYMERQMV